MIEVPAPEVTQLLRAWSEGDERALEKLMPLVYDEPTASLSQSRRLIDVKPGVIEPRST